MSVLSNNKMKNKMKNIENKVSIFKNVQSIKPIKDENLFTLCTSPEHKEIITLLRSLEKGSEDYINIKKSLTCFTPSITCTQRGANYMTSHSGYVCLDFDNVEDTTIFKEKLKQFTFIAFCAVSCSGNGVYAMVKIDKPNLHTQHYESLIDFFKRLEYPIDTSCKDLARTRIMSYDSNYYYNENATVWSDTKIPQPYISKSTRTQCNGADINIQAIYTIRDYVVANGIDITSGRNYWLALGSYIASILGSNEGKSVFRDISQFHPKFNETECNKTFDSVVSNSKDYSISVLLNACTHSGVPNLKDLI